jgi:hypothetical protein
VFLSDNKIYLLLPWVEKRGSLTFNTLWRTGGKMEICITFNPSPRMELL